MHGDVKALGCECMGLRMHGDANAWGCECMGCECMGM